MTATLRARGAHVLTFARKVPNFGRIGELTQAILEMLRSQDWRAYADATGEYHFRACEFDYFLAEQGIDARDLVRLYLTPAEREELLAAMTSEDPRTRRPLDTVVRAHPKGALAGNWARQGWAETKHPVGRRTAVRMRHGVSSDKRAEQSRRQQVQDRRPQLDAIIERVIRQARTPIALRYIIDELHKRVAKRGRKVNLIDRQQWTRDYAACKGNAKALAKQWGVSQQVVSWRKKQIKSTI